MRRRPMEILGILFILVLFLHGCGKSDSKAVYLEKSQDKLVSVINDYGIEAGGNTSLDKTIYNDEKGIYFTLFNDNKMTYELIGLGTGEGIWTLEENTLFLFADTGLFDLNVEVREKGNEGLYFFYRDRFGSQVVKVNIKNDE